MKKTDTVVQLLKECFPRECNIVGSTNVRDIAEGKIKYVSPEGASKVDTNQVLQFLALLAILLNNTLSIYIILKKERGEKPQPDILRIEIVKRGLKPPNIDENFLNQLCEAVCKKLEDTTIEDEEN
ncbi:hypothetical protein IQ268_28705 [Oculatella sp. LEGE 06141]|uniref:hypothetical protein n=1 Tax=Oculatella sp. LEGE 06141 TaxID=1828648 RepID=UPI001881D8AD|nr:hypothetical protein [Oculatella sp. LEGE 06141]MBE9182535.1 hypothetical protein [Oculatella sp. LEGE 06141]